MRSLKPPFALTLALCLFSCLPQEEVIDGGDATANNLQTMEPPGRRGELCEMERPCAEGLACVGGFCQIECVDERGCAPYSETFCIAPVASRQSERYCLRAGDYTCDMASDADGFCAATQGEAYSCEEGACMMERRDPLACTMDAQCDEGSACDRATSTCVETCEEDAECATSTQACLLMDASRPGGPKRCQDITSCEMAPDPDAWCQAEEGSLRYACDGVACALVERPTRVIQIVDASLGMACSASRGGSREPGADIIAVELFDPEGGLLAYGKVEQVVFGNVESDFISTAHLNGQMPALDASGCPAPDDEGERFRRDSVLSLGCSGYAMIGFQDADIEPIDLTSGMVIGVSEYGPICDNPGNNDTEGLDRYEVYLCEDLNEDGIATNAECDRALSDAPRGGYNFYTLP